MTGFENPKIEKDGSVKIENYTFSTSGKGS